MQCLLIGNFGVGNLGDEALKEYFLKAFPTVTWTVVSAHPAKSEVARLPLGIRSLFEFRWLGTLRAYYRCDAVVFGGGSLFTDTESVTACVLWWLHTVPARVLGKDIHLAFQGIGPFKSSMGEWFTWLALQSATTISVRDSASKERAEKLVKNKNVIQSCDPVIWLIEKEKLEICTKNILILIPRKNSSEKFTKSAENHAKSRVWEAIHILSMEPDNPSEKKYVKSLADRFSDLPVFCHNVETLSQLLSYIAPATQVVSERFHGALPAIVYKKRVEVISQKPGDKLSQLAVELPSETAVLAGEQNLRRMLSIE